MPIAITPAQRLARARKERNRQIDGFKGAETRRQCLACKEIKKVERRLAWMKRQIMLPEHDPDATEQEQRYANAFLEGFRLQGNQHWLLHENSGSLDGDVTLQPHREGLVAEINRVLGQWAALTALDDQNGHFATTLTEIKAASDMWLTKRKVDEETGEIREGYKTAYTGWDGKYKPTPNEKILLEMAHKNAEEQRAMERASRMYLEFAYRRSRQHMIYFITLTAADYNQWMMNDPKELSKHIRNYRQQWLRATIEHCARRITHSNREAIGASPIEGVEFGFHSNIEHGEENGRKHVHVLVMAASLPMGTEVKTHVTAQNAREHITGKEFSAAHFTPTTAGKILWPMGHAYLLPVKWSMGDPLWPTSQTPGLPAFYTNVASLTNGQLKLHKPLGNASLCHYVAGHSAKSISSRLHRRRPNEKYFRPMQHCGSVIIREIAARIIELLDVHEPTNMLRMALREAPAWMETPIPADAIMSEIVRQSRSELTHEEWTATTETEHLTHKPGEVLRQEHAASDQTEAKNRTRQAVQTALAEATRKWRIMPHGLVLHDKAPAKAQADTILKAQQIAAMQSLIEPLYGKTDIHRLGVIKDDIEELCQQLGIKAETRKGYARPKTGTYAMLNTLNLRIGDRPQNETEEQLQKRIKAAREPLAELLWCCQNIKDETAA